jgi:hypothetical protein
MQEVDERDYNKDGKVSPAEKKRFKKENPKEVISNRWGFAYAVINQDRALKRFFNKKVTEYLRNPSGFSKEAFFLELEKQPFAQKYSTAAIEDMNFQARYPEIYRQQIDGEVEELRDITLNMGAQLDEQELYRLAQDKRRLRLTDAQVTNRLANDYLVAREGRFTGAAGNKQDQLNRWARSNGLSLSPDVVQKYVRRIAAGDMTEDDVKNDLRRTYLLGAYPAWADRIEQGFDPSEIAAPYKSKMAALLEIDEEQIDLNDSLLQRAMQGVGADGKPKVTPLYEFDREIRNDQRWQYTNNAKETYSGMADQLLKMFGFR